MKESTHDRLLEAASKRGLDARGHADYSGRGMNGRTTHAVSFDFLRDLIVTVGDAAHALGVEEAQGQSRQVADEFFRDVEAIRTDDLGRGIVAY